MEPHRAVTFDVNAYARIASPAASVQIRTAELVAAEARAGVLAVLHPIVALEQLAAVGGSTRLSESAVLASIRAMRLHCSVLSKGRNLAILVDPEANMCKTLFGLTPPGAIETLGVVEGLIRGLADGEDPAEFVRLNATPFETLREHVSEVELTFEKDFWEAIIKPLNPSIGSWVELGARPDVIRSLEEHLKTPHLKLAFARVMVMKAADQLEVTLPDGEIEQKAHWLVDYLNVPFALYQYIVRHVAGEAARLNKPSRRNWIWDLHILFGIGDNHSVNGLPLTLVSSDREMAGAAKAAGYGQYVLGIDEYLGQLSIA